MEAKLKVIIDDQVTETLAKIQDAEEYGVITEGLEELDEFIFDRQDNEKTALELLLVVRNMRKIFARLNAQYRN